HEGTLAHLPGGQYMAELAAAQRLIQMVIRLAFHIGGRVPGHGASGHVEGTPREVERGACALWRSHRVSIPQPLLILGVAEGRRRTSRSAVGPPRPSCRPALPRSAGGRNLLSWGRVCPAARRGRRRRDPRPG